MITVNCSQNDARRKSKLQKEKNDILKCRDGEIYTVCRIYFDKEMEAKQKKKANARSRAIVSLRLFFRADILYFPARCAKHVSAVGWKRRTKLITLLTQASATALDKGYRVASFEQSESDGFCIFILNLKAEG